MQPVLRIFAEAAWITVLYAAAMVVLGRSAPLLGPVEFTGLVALGAVVGRLGRPREGIGPLLLILAVIVGAVVGWLASPDVRQMLPNLPRAAGLHPFGLLAGVAVLRGALINTGPKAAEDLERMVRVVPGMLAFVWAYATLGAQPGLWLSFAVNAMWGTVMFIAAAVVSIGMARLDYLHSGEVDARQRRGWRWLVLAVGLGVVPVAIPVAVLTGIPLEALLTPVAGPIQFLVGLIAIPLSWIIWLVALVLRPIAGPLAVFLDELSSRSRDMGRPNSPEASLAGSLIAAAILLVTVFVILLVIFLAARWFLRSRSGAADDLEAPDADTERQIVIPERPSKLAPRSRVRRWGTPRDVVGAYMSALGELEKHDELARRPSETPAQHAARLRKASDALGGDLARLAAGYQLARYGERRITTLENARAVGRFQRLRRLLRASTA